MLYPVTSNTKIIEIPFRVLGESTWQTQKPNDNNYIKFILQRINIQSDRIEKAISYLHIDPFFITENETYNKVKEIPQLITLKEAYHGALEILEDYENKWQAYVEEEAKMFSFFEEDE